MLGRRRRITRSKTDIKAQAGGMVGRYTRGKSAGSALRYLQARPGSPDSACRSVGNLATPPLIWVRGFHQQSQLAGAGGVSPGDPRPEVRMKTSVVVLAVLSLAILVSVSGRNVVQARDVWPGPDGVTATDGMNPGEAVITWSTVEEAAYYRIGWVAQADREVGTDGDAKWREGFVFADVANRGQASHLITGLAPGVEYDFVVASHDGHLPKAPQPVEVAALRLREDAHPNEYAPPGRPNGDADRRLVAGGGVPPSVDFQNSGACESTAGSGTVTMFGEDVNRYLCEDTQGSIYRIFVPVQYTSADDIAQSIHRRTNDGMQNREKRVAIYKALILELAIQKALQDRNHEDVYVDFLQTGRDISNDADEVADYVRAGLRPGGPRRGRHVRTGATHRPRAPQYHPGTGREIGDPCLRRCDGCRGEPHHRHSDGAGQRLVAGAITGGGPGVGRRDCTGRSGLGPNGLRACAGSMG